MYDVNLYEIVVSPLSEEEGGGFVAQMPDLPGLLADGETAAEAAEDAQKAALEWLDAYEKMGREIPAPGSAMQMALAKRKKEMDLLVKLRDALRERDEDFSALSDRLDTIEQDVQFLIEMVEGARASERFTVLTKEVHPRQRDLFTRALT